MVKSDHKFRFVELSSSSNAAVMPGYKEVTVEYDQQNDNTEDGVVVPVDRINPETLLQMAEELVTREWSELADADCTFENKIEQVMQQFKDNKIKVVFDLTGETCNRGGLFVRSF